jgi:hypothetical protein
MPGIRYFMIGVADAHGIDFSQQSESGHPSA